jgi:Rrf2 family protein
MRLSKKGEYAVRALVEIGFEAHQRPDSLIQISTVAKRTNIPEKFLEQILLALRNGGVLKSKRGVEGGYSLAKTPKDITLGEVIRLLDGPLAVRVPTRNRAGCASRCSRCATRLLAFSTATRSPASSRKCKSIAQPRRRRGSLISESCGRQFDAKALKQVSSDLESIVSTHHLPAG